MAASCPRNLPRTNDQGGGLGQLVGRGLKASWSATTAPIGAALVIPPIPAYLRFPLTTSALEVILGMVSLYLR
jgi:hypothetical protein